MADKLRTTYPITVSFATGEQPTATKLSSIALQSKYGQRILEKAIGDVWNQSADAVTVDYPLQISNLARMMGQSQYLNSIFPPLTTSFIFTETMGSEFADKNNGTLKFIPSSISSGTGAFVTEQADIEDVNSTGDFYVDSSTGQFWTYTSITAGDTITYYVDPTQWQQGNEDVTFNVIPDPIQTAGSFFKGCRIQKSGSDYYLWLPPRVPFTASQLGDRKPERWPSDTDVALAANLATTTSSPYKLWQSTSSDALTLEHYRYILPKELQDLGPGTTIPAGILYLWNQTTETIIDDITFSYENNYKLKIESSTTDLDTLDTATESSADYNSGISLICCGASLAKSIYQLTNSFYRHKHTGSELDAAISHSNIIEQNPDPGGSTYPTGAPDKELVPYWEGDTHTSLLSRYGSQTSPSMYRDEYNNAMLGHLVLADGDPSNTTPTDKLDMLCPYGSYRLFFGNADNTNASNIMCYQGRLNLTGKNGMLFGAKSTTYPGTSYIEYKSNGSSGYIYGLYGTSIYLGQEPDGTLDPITHIYADQITAEDSNTAISATSTGDTAIEAISSATGSVATMISQDGAIKGVTDIVDTVAICGQSTKFHGVYGQTDSNNTSHASVLGYANQGAYGVWGYSDGNYGVYGYSITANKAGVYGYNKDTDGIGVIGIGDATTSADTTTTAGVLGKSSTGYGVYGESDASGKAGVYGENIISGGYGVYGTSSAGTGVYATTGANSIGKAALYAYASYDGSPSNAPAIYAEANKSNAAEFVCNYNQKTSVIITSNASCNPLQITRRQVTSNNGSPYSVGSLSLPILSNVETNDDVAEDHYGLSVVYDTNKSGYRFLVIKTDKDDYFAVPLQKLT